MIGSGRDKIESQQDLQKAAVTVQNLDLDGLIVVGGDDSNTNAAVLAEYFLSQSEHAMRILLILKLIAVMYLHCMQIAAKMHRFQEHPVHISPQQALSELFL